METATKTKDFKEARKSYIGGSDIATVMGLSRWNTPLGLWAEKTGKIEPRDLSDNQAVELGIELEDFVAKKFERKSGKKVRRDSREFVHKDLPYCVAHIDRWVVGGELLECKTASAWKAKEWDGDEIPIEYCLQVNWYLGICEMTTGYIAVLIGGQKFVWKEIKFDQELFDKQIESAKKFWNEFVLPEVPPMASEGDTETLLKMFPQVTRDILFVEDEAKAEYLDSAIEKRSEIQREIDAILKEKDEIDSKLKQVIGDSAGVQTGKHKITWAVQVRVTADSDKLKEAGLFDQYSKTSSTRVLRVSANKKDKKGE